MNIAILGVRGIPACYSRYDTLVEELATGLVKNKLADVIVYCRHGYYKNKVSNYNGVKQILSADSSHKGPRKPLPLADLIASCPF